MKKLIVSLCFLFMAHSTSSFASISNLLSDAELVTAPFPLNEKVLFTAQTVQNGQEVWVSDGTKSGTHILKDIALGADSSSHFWNQSAGEPIFHKLESLAVFVQRDENYKENLWVTDGTSTGTKLIKSFNISCDFCQYSEDEYNYSTELSNFVESENNIFFQVNSSTGKQLWRTDGTESGTELVLDLSDTFEVYSSTSFNGAYYFLVKTRAEGSYDLKGELWMFNEQSQNAEYVFDMDYSVNLIGAEDYIFTASGAYNIGLVNLSDELTYLLSDGRDGGGGGHEGMTIINGKPLIRLFDEVWFSDGTVEGTVSLPVPFPSKGLVSNSQTALLNDFDNLYFTDGTPEGTILVDTMTNIVPVEEWSYFTIGKYTEGSIYYYVKNYDSGVVELWGYDEGQDEISLIETLTSYGEFDEMHSPLIVGNNLFLVEGKRNDSDNTGLWVKNISPSILPNLGDDTRGTATDSSSGGSFGLSLLIVFSIFYHRRKRFL